MLYTDFSFIALYALLALAVYALRTRPAAREWLIIAFGLFLIATWGYFDLGLFLALVGVNYAVGIAMVRASPDGARNLLALAVTFDIAVLALFKYSNFAGGAVSALTGWAVPQFPLGIPLAISFYVFHLISYLVDLSAGRIENPGFRQYLFYVGFFPHVIAGPIVRVWQLVPQIGVRSRVRANMFLGLHYVVIGYFLKSVAADNIGKGIDPVWQGKAGFALSTADHWIVALLFYCQIYADFAGYSLIALGMARMLGYRLPANFRCPMRAVSLWEFWRRWHITLSRWLRDYLYIPLGGNRDSAAKTYRNIMVTMGLGGLWHGAGWGFIAWGLMHGLGLVLERLAGARTRLSPARLILGWILAQLWVTVAWVFFRAPDLHAAAAFLRRMAGVGAGTGEIAHGALLYLCVCALPVVAHQFAPTLLRRLSRRRLFPVLGLITGFIALLNIIVPAPGTAFIYFRF